MKRYLLLIALTAAFACSTLAEITYVQAEESYSDSNSAEEMDQTGDATIGQESEADQGQWIADEPADMENAEAYESDSEAPTEPAN